MKGIRISLMITMLVVLASFGFAQGPWLINYQGKLLNSSGVPLASGNYDMTFNIYDAQTVGTLIYSEVHSGGDTVTVTGGYFNVTLGSITTLQPYYFSTDGNLWLEVVATINSATETFTRTQLVSAPSAMTLVPGASIVRDAATANFYVGNGSPGWLTLVSRRAIWGQTSSGIAVQGDANSGTGVLGLANTGNAVSGTSTSGLGVRGVSTDNDGVTGQTSGAYKSGVFGTTDVATGYGITGRSSSYFGVFAWGGGDGSGSDAIGDLILQGTRGEIFVEGNYLNVYSNYNINLELDNNNNNSNSYLNVWNGADSIIFVVDEAGNMTASGTKSAAVQTESSGARLLYAMESPEVWFEDFGSASLTNGAAVVPIEPIFAETVSLKDYHVFLTPVGGTADLYVANKTATSFEVKDGNGASSIAFDYRIIAKRKGYEGTRLESPPMSAEK